MLFEKKSLSESHWAAVFHAPKAFVEMGLQKTGTSDGRTLGAKLKFWAFQIRLVACDL